MLVTQEASVPSGWQRLHGSLSPVDLAPSLYAPGLIPTDTEVASLWMNLGVLAWPCYIEFLNYKKLISHL